MMFAEAQLTLENSGLPVRCWSIVKFADDRMCLVHEDGTWVAGRFERGAFHHEFEGTDFSEILSRFVTWVAQIETLTEIRSKRAAGRLTGPGSRRPIITRSGMRPRGSGSTRSTWWRASR